MGAVYTQLSLKERRRIEDWWHAKVPVREMARVLKRHKSTIFREIKRNFWADDAFPKKYAGYFGHAAQLQTDKRRSVQRKLIRHPDLCKTVVAKVKLGWTPEQIGNRMIYEGAKLRVCQETIYRYIYSKEGMDQELWWYLPEHRMTAEKGDEAAETLLSATPTRPEVIICVNDLVVVGAIHACRKAGHRIPDDISITGYNDIPLIDINDPPLTIVRMHLYEIGLAAGQLMLD